MEFTLATLPPIVGLGILGALVPWAIMRFSEDSLAALARAGALSAVLMIAAGAGLFLWLYGAAGMPAARLASDPGAAARHFIGLGLRSALVWAPVLVLTLIGLGQGIERRRGKAMARRDRD